jgi:hypothetical protein
MSHNLAQCQKLVQKAVAAGAKVGTYFCLFNVSQGPPRQDIDLILTSAPVS